MYCMQFGWQFREMLQKAENAEGRKSPWPRRWLDYGPMRVYTRIGYRLIGGEPTLCVQIANIETPEAYQRRGLFSRMVALIRENTNLPIMLENCRMDFADHLLTKGWQVVTSMPIAKDIVLR